MIRKASMNLVAGHKATSETGERILLRFACAEMDTDYNVTFVRSSRKTSFICERIDLVKNHRESALNQFRSLFKRKNRTEIPNGEWLDIPIEEIDISTVRCTCGRQGEWVRCGQCGAMICEAMFDGRRYVCRESCGASFPSTVPLTSVTASNNQETSSSVMIADDRAKPKLLTRR